MRKEVENWFKQAKKDLEAAEKNLKIKEYYITAFLSHQAAEKALKAYILFKKRVPAEGHSLIFLARLANVPKRFLPFLRKLSPQYFISRYPDIVEETPYELYDESQAKELLKIAKEVIEWIEKRLK